MTKLEKWRLEAAFLYSTEDSEKSWKPAVSPNLTWDVTVQTSLISPPLDKAEERPLEPGALLRPRSLLSF